MFVSLVSVRKSAIVIFSETKNLLQKKNNEILRRPASCFSCGYGETCKVGIPYFLHGEGVKISEEIIPNVTKQSEVMQAAVEAGKKLGQRLQ